MKLLRWWTNAKQRLKRLEIGGRAVGIGEVGGMLVVAAAVVGQFRL